jgi:hypothetical protein
MTSNPMAGIHVASFQHGTHSGYSNHGCRCNPCREAGRAWRQDWYERNREKRIAQVMASRKRQQQKIGAGDLAGKHWTPEEDAIVLRNDIRIKDIALILHRSYKATCNRRERLRKDGRPWTAPNEHNHE